MLQLCYNFATTYGTTWPQEAHRTPCYHFATTLLPLCYHLCYHLAPRGPQDTMLQLCYNFATTYATTWRQEAPSFNRELSPKSCLKKHPLNEDFLGISWNESPPQPSKHKRILILVLKFRSFNRELSPKSRLKKHPLDGDFSALWWNESPPQLANHKQIMILVKIVWALKQRHNELYENSFIVSDPPLFEPCIKTIHS